MSKVVFSGLVSFGGRGRDGYPPLNSTPLFRHPDFFCLWGGGGEVLGTMSEKLGKVLTRPETFLQVEFSLILHRAVSLKLHEVDGKVEPRLVSKPIQI